MSRHMSHACCCPASWPACRKSGGRDSDEEAVLSLRKATSIKKDKSKGFQKEF